MKPIVEERTLHSYIIRDTLGNEIEMFHHLVFLDERFNEICEKHLYYMRNQVDEITLEKLSEKMCEDDFFKRRFDKNIKSTFTLK